MRIAPSLVTPDVIRGPAFSWSEKAAGCRIKSGMTGLGVLRHAELVSASIPPLGAAGRGEEWTLKQVQGDGLVVGAAE